MDQLIIAVWGRALIPVSIVHTVVLLWESWATMDIISSRKPLQASQKVVGMVVLSAAWMLVTGPVWQRGERVFLMTRKRYGRAD